MSINCLEKYLKITIFLFFIFWPLECNSSCKECSLIQDNCTVCYNSSLQYPPSCKCIDGYYKYQYHCLSKQRKTGFLFLFSF